MTASCSPFTAGDGRVKRLAILGGTFNPIHLGHLIIAETALVQTQLDQVIWVPSCHPPHRARHTVVDFHQRVVMVQQAIANHPHFTLSTLEAHQTGQSFAIHTLTALQQQHPNSQWVWIMGLDAFQSLPRWYRCQDLIPQCTWAIAPRGMAQSESASPPTPTALDRCQIVADQVQQRYGLTPDWLLLDMPRIDLSSSLIRSYCRDRRSIRYLVPDAIADYIRQEGLYREG